MVSIAAVVPSADIGRMVDTKVVGTVNWRSGECGWCYWWVVVGRGTTAWDSQTLWKKFEGKQRI